ncbi:MAG: hypothetical protein J6W09_04430 [Bacteroidales bacterium]|nr:hypothetical protein [Bacteroidales bacterium]
MAGNYEDKKGEFLNALERLCGTMCDVSRLWYELKEEDFTNAYDGYPFHKSLDDLIFNVIEWEEKVNEKLTV